MTKISIEPVTVLASFVSAATIVGATPLLRLLIERGSYSREALIK